MTITITQPNGTSREVLAEPESYRQHALMEAGVVSLVWRENTFSEVPIGSSITIAGETFTLYTAARIKKEAGDLFECSALFRDETAILERFKMLNSVDKRVQWAMTARPEEHLSEIVKNLNSREGGSRWSGVCRISSAEKLIEYNHTTLLDALKSIATTFSTEWEIIGTTITIGAVEYNKDNPISLEYGRGLLPNIVRAPESDTPPVGRLFVQGGSRNIDRTKYGSSVLLLPKGKRYYHTDGKRYVVSEDRRSISIEGSAATSAESSASFAEVYPSRVGAVSKVAVPNAEKNFFDVHDDSLDFDVSEYLIAGGGACKLIFQSGKLSGREFEVSYKHSDKRFEIVPQEIDGVMMPSDVFTPAVGDTYALFGISLPEAYIKRAEMEMLRQAVEQLSKESQSPMAVSGEISPYYVRDRWDEWSGKLKVGATLNLNEFGNLIGKRQRITATKAPLYDLKSLTITIGDFGTQKQSSSIGTALQEIGYLKTAVETLTSGESGSDLYLSRRKPDSARGLITFEQGLTSLQGANLRGGAMFGAFSDGLYSGEGGKIDSKGNGELQSLKIRGSLDVAELVINKMTAVGGEVILTEGDTISAVRKLTAEERSALSLQVGDISHYHITLRSKHEGYQATHSVGEVLKGIVNSLDKERVGDLKQPEKGAVSYYTSWMLIRKVITPTAGSPDNALIVQMYPDSETPENANRVPCELMNIARWGHTTDKAQQSTLVLSSRDGRIMRLSGVSKPILDVTNYGSVLGQLPNALKADKNGKPLPIVEGQDYAYLRGLVVQDIIRTDYQGAPISEIVDRGTWSSAASYFAAARNPQSGQFETSDVWYNGARWRCLTTRTRQTPSPTATQWAMIEATLSLSIEVVQGSATFTPRGSESCRLRAVVMRGGYDISAQIPANRLEWTRQSEAGAAADEAWKISHKDSAQELEVTKNDITGATTIAVTLYDENGKPLISA